jgi:hypothetical protein
MTKAQRDAGNRERAAIYRALTKEHRDRIYALTEASGTRQSGRPKPPTTAIRTPEKRYFTGAR